MEQITVDVHDGLHCSSCERRLQALLLRVPGVRRVEVSRVRGEAEIYYNPHAAMLDELMERMKRGGFKAETGPR